MKLLAQMPSVTPCLCGKAELTTKNSPRSNHVCVVWSWAVAAIGARHGCFVLSMLLSRTTSLRIHATMACFAVLPRGRSRA